MYIKKLLVGLVFCSLLLIGWSFVANSQTYQTDLEDQLDHTKKEIDRLNIDLDGLEIYQGTLQEAIDQLDSQIVELESSIISGQAEIEKLQNEIATLQEDIEAQSELLAIMLSDLYKHSGASSLELLFASENFSDFINNQEYLGQLKDSLSASVLSLSVAQDQKTKAQADLRQSIEAMTVRQNLLNGQRQERQALLAETAGQERIFREKVQELQARQAQQEAELEAYLAGLIKAKVSLGQVSRGEIIGKMGNTGWSTGPHLHLVIYEAQGEQVTTKFDPEKFLVQTGAQWPVGGNGGFISQRFHPGHQALDIAGVEGTPIVAIADGTIIHRDCIWREYGDSANFAVIIDHGDYYSLYVHLQAPNNPKYADCSINRRSSYGTPSIDYSTTQ